ncbi:MAG: PilZ domain-containing protein [Phycisphaeraceae bacterium]|nr:PilZ domain-containing protein [Phycisphaeraceae bacterium]
MEPARNFNPLAFGNQTDARERRRHGRLLCEDLRCNIGQIRDLSASGMKIFRKGSSIGQVGECLEITIEYMDSHMTVRAQIIRNDKAGFRKRLYGFAFVDLTEEQKARLTALARIASDTLTIAHR